ncbi:MAG: DUF2314 domain-containing protein [Verrucomicrobia bacterium]|nr:DUF2314 domain-containing protein [Verrucomicrobiota bacterium]
MPLSLRTPGGDRTFDALLVLFWGGLLCWIGFGFWSRPELGLAGWLLLTLGVPLVACSGLLWCRRGWARWPATGLLGLLAAGQIWGLFQHGFGFGRVAILVGLLWTAVDVFRHFSPAALGESAEAGTEEGTRPMISLALLLRRPRYLDATGLARYCEAAWGGSYRVLSANGEPRPPEPDAEPGWVTGRAPLLLVGSPDGLFVVHNHDRPYFDPGNDPTSGTVDLRLRQVLQENRAWIAVDLMTPTDESATRESLYLPVSRLIAELAGPDCQAIFRPETEQFNYWDDTLEERLRGPDALALFADPTKLPVIEVDDDDPRMLAAVTEARTRWPEFVEAFGAKAGEHFSVKAPVEGGGNTEFIWIAVEALEDERVSGHLGNDPVDLGDLKEGSPVSVPVAEINDWVFLRDGQPHGLFTPKVLEAIHSESKAAGGSAEA